MSEPDPAASGGGRQALLQALEVARYARLAVAIGAAVTVLTLVFFVGLLSGGATTQPLPYYLGLGFVVFVSTAMLAVGVLTGRRVLRLAADPAALVRRGGTAGLLAGLTWAVVAAGLAAVAVDGPVSARTAVTLALPWAPLLTVAGAWGVHLRYKRQTPVRWLSAAGGFATLAGALVVADLAALDLAVLLGRRVPGPGQFTLELFGAGVGLLAVGHLAQAAAGALAGGDRALPAVIGALPATGAVGYLALAPGPVALALLAGAFALVWVPAGWWLRGVEHGQLPRAPDALAADEPTD